MKGTRRAIGIGCVVLLAALGTGLALEKASSHPGGAAVPAPTNATDTVTAPVSSAPEGTQAGADSESTSQEYDRSDLLLSQG